MFRRKGYVEPPLWPDEPLVATASLASRHPLARALKRRAVKLAFCAFSVLLNLYFIYKAALKRWAEWPAPLDNYQTLHPIVAYTTPPANPREHAVVTGLYTDAFAPAVATLGHTLNAANSTAARLLFYLPDKISARALCIASAPGWLPVPIERIAPPFPGHHHHHFLDQYSKLHLWTLDQRGFDAVLYLDADTLVRRAFDELFRLPYTFGAVQDVYPAGPGFVTSFNAGVLLLRPDTALFHDMAAKIATARYRAWEAEQAFLNHYFGAEAVRLPYAYNANLAIKQRAPALWAALQREMRVMHFTMVKPFLQGDYAAVPLDQLEKNAKHLARQFPVFKDEIAEWLDAWKDTKRTHAWKLAQCTLLS